MAKVLSETAVYKKVGTSDFSSLSVEQLKSLVSILHRISPELAKQLMNNFTDFRTCANKMTGILRMKVLNLAKSKRKTRSEIYSKCLSLLKELDIRLSQQQITEEDKEFVENHLVMIACLMHADTKKRRAKALRIITIATSVAVTALALLVALVNSDDSDSDCSSDSDENDPDRDDDNLLEQLDYYDALDKIPDIENKLLDPDYDTFCDPESPFYLGPSTNTNVIYIDDEDDYDENDESYAAQDYIDSRPWGIDNDGY